MFAWKHVGREEVEKDGTYVDGRKHDDADDLRCSDMRLKKLHGVHFSNFICSSGIRFTALKFYVDAFGLFVYVFYTKR